MSVVTDLLNCSNLLGLFTRPSFRLALVVGLFAVATLPFAAHYAIHYPDERHYTDGVLEMMRSQDWITPHTTDGTPRFQKPILTYWSVALGFWSWDVSPLGARIPFVFWGITTILVTYAAAMDLGKDRQLAFLAAQITACHPLVLLNATRSIPDMPLCLFVSVAIWGYAKLCTNDGQSSHGHWLAYVGTAGAVATKGFPIFLLTGTFFILYGFARLRGRGPSLRQLWHGPSLCVSFVLAFWWFLAVFWQHGSVAWEAFWRDQIDQRIASVPWQPLRQFPEAIGLLALSFLPWVFPLLARRGAKGIPPVPVGDGIASQPLFVAWICSYLVAVSFVTEFSHRYLLPLVPSTAILLARLLTVQRESIGRLWLDRLVNLALGSLGALALATLVIMRQAGRWESAFFAVAIMSMALVVVLLTQRFGDTLSRIQTLGFCLHMVSPLLFLHFQVLALPDQGKQIAAQLMQMPHATHESFVVWSKPALASKIRLCSRNQLHIKHVDITEQPQLSPGERLICVSPPKGADESEIQPVRWVSTGYRSLKMRPFLMSLIRGTFSEYLSENEEHYYVSEAASVSSEETRMAQQERDHAPAAPQR